MILSMKVVQNIYLPLSQFLQSPFFSDVCEVQVYGLIIKDKNVAVLFIFDTFELINAIFLTHLIIWVNERSCVW